jgi:3-phenylpropionate/trans-cinnamate dioxygenase ferredoxin reductase subunit
VSIDRAARKVLLRLRHIARLRPPGAGDRRAIRLLDIPNANLDSVRTVDASTKAVVARLHRAGPASSSIGAGFIGLEFAATARAKGLEVDVIELGTRVMARAVTAEISIFQSRHTAAGIRFIWACRLPASRATAARSPASASATDGISKPT